MEARTALSEAFGGGGNGLGGSQVPFGSEEWMGAMAFWALSDGCL
jgi:hypothetical protein